MINKNIDYSRDYETRLVFSKRAHRYDLMPGNIVKLRYDGEVRFGIVIAPDFDKKLHIISLKVLPMHIYDKLQETYRATKTITDITQLSNELYELSRNYIEAYHAYRTYFWSKITHLEIVQFRMNNKLKNVSTVDNTAVDLLSSINKGTLIDNL